MTKQDVLKTLTCETGEALCKALNGLDKDGVPYFISEGGRSLLTQCLYALQGRLGEGKNAVPFESLIEACRQAGIRPPDKNIITWTLQSNHLSGNAVDIVPLKDGKPDWNNHDDRIVAAMKNAGFIWGGDWEKVDKPHFELRR
jgi:hypothetical protein